MQTTRRARGMAGVAAAGFLATAALHASGYDAVAAMAAETQALAVLVPMLWLGFAADLVVLGLIVAVVAWRPVEGGRSVLSIVGLGPLAAAGLQYRYIGFIPPTALLVVLGLFTLATAAAWSRPVASDAPG